MESRERISRRFNDGLSSFGSNIKSPVIDFDSRELAAGAKNHEVIAGSNRRPALELPQPLPLQFTGPQVEAAKRVVHRREAIEPTINAEQRIVLAVQVSPLVAPQLLVAAVGLNLQAQIAE